ncbi:MAG: 2,3,4,5-tetrahydropyridine-2,6-dicarboxylate N-acetyltransferase [Clostridium sp.]|nr:2,3,4,5-tetrahydropyridine-2,6-dicarboxylate N-acetyltransferase [Clostridium sp.]
MNYNDLTDPYEIAKFIRDSVKTTPIKAYINGDLQNADLSNIEWYGNNNFYVLIGEANIIKEFVDKHQSLINHYHFENDRRNSAIPMLNITNINARIEPGAIIRDRVKIEDNAVIMMGAVINIGAEIGEGTMIDMNAVVGARAKIGKRSHLGAGAVVAGVLEPPSKSPCEIGDDVLIGANAVILEGVKVGSSSVIAAGSVVTKDVPSGVVMAGSPARIIKSVDEQTKDKTKLLDDLRK